MQNITSISGIGPPLLVVLIVITVFAIVYFLKIIMITLSQFLRADIWRKPGQGAAAAQPSAE